MGAYSFSIIEKDIIVVNTVVSKLKSMFIGISK